MMYVLLLIGFFFLVKGADLFVDGSSSLAGILKVPSVIIGLTIVAFGTSAPEAAVSISAAVAGNNDIAFSNVVGSNIFNTLVVVGCSAIIADFTVNKSILKRDMPLNIIISALLIVFAANLTMSQWEGLILTIGIILYVIVMVRSAINNRAEEEPIKQLSLPKSLVFIAIGLAAVIVGGDLVVDNATLIARSWGVSDNFIALTIVAIGTSLPELMTSVVASRKGQSGLALGNAIGSNISNILFVLGFSCLLHPLHLEAESWIDSIILLGVAVLIYLFSRTKGKLSRKEGIIMVAVYVVYTIYLFIR